MEKFGFVYIWYDRHRKKYYIGSHWGTEVDGYICSSRTMRKAYRRRPKDFKRRILSRVYSDRTDLLKEEQKWLDKVKNKSRYYNLNFVVGDGYWWVDKQSSLTVSEKIANTRANWTTEKREEVRQKLRYEKSDDHRKKIGDFWRGKKTGPMTDETKKKISDAKVGRVKSTEHREKISKSLTGRKNPEHSEKMKGKIPWNKGKGKIRIRVRKSREPEASSHMNVHKFECQCCGTVTNKGNFTRWHGENCKRTTK